MIASLEKLRRFFAYETERIAIDMYWMNTCTHVIMYLHVLPAVESLLLSQCV